MFGGSITGLPIIETINSDITEYIATNVISITDGQFYTNKRLFLDSYRPAIDSGLSVSRIGSNAQCKLIKVYSVGIKNLMNQQKSKELLIDLWNISLLCYADRGNCIFYLLF
jgi:F-type H+-transporting ATPase subunit alpha